jgi:hypothetical protein
MTSKTIAESDWKSVCTNDEVDSSAAIRLAVCSGHEQRGLPIFKCQPLFIKLLATTHSYKVCCQQPLALIARFAAEHLGLCALVGHPPCLFSAN